MSIHSGFLLLLILMVAVVHGVPQEYENLYGGDIVLTPEQQILLDGSSTLDFFAQSAAVRGGAHLWPNGVVPYTLHRSLSSLGRRAIQRAINVFATQTCIRFVPRTNQINYVQFIQGQGCYSFVGRTRQGSQDISIGRGCESEGIVIHEMLHALGRWHEQSRPDRNRYVRINMANIQRGRERNFERLNPRIATTQGLPYDTMSIMQYSAFAFSRNRQPTIEPVDRRIPLTALGQRQRMTPRDLQHVQRLYC